MPQRATWTNELLRKTKWPALERAGPFVESLHRSSGAVIGDSGHCLPGQMTPFSPTSKASTTNSCCTLIKRQRNVEYPPLKALTKVHALPMRAAADGRLESGAIGRCAIPSPQPDTD